MRFPRFRRNGSPVIPYTGRWQDDPRYEFLITMQDLRPNANLRKFQRTIIARSFPNALSLAAMNLLPLIEGADYHFVSSIDNGPAPEPSFNVPLTSKMPRHTLHHGL